MRDCLSAVSKIIAGAFAALFVVFTLIALLLFNARWQLLTAEAWTRAFTEQRFYDRLPAVAAEELTFSMTFNPCEQDPSRCEGEGPVSPGEEGGPPDFVVNLSPENWEDLLTQLLPAGWLQEQVENLFQQLFGYFDGSRAELSLTISMAELKASLQGDTGVEAVLTMMRSQPPCDAQGLAELPTEAIPGMSEGGMLSCRPPEEILEEIKPQIRAMLVEVTASIPPQIDLLSRSATGEGPSQLSLQQIRWGFLGMYLSPLLPFALLLLVTLFGVRSIKDFLRWWGFPFMVAGLMGLGLSVLSGPLIEWGIAWSLNRPTTMAISPALLQMGLDVGRQLMRSLFMWAAIESGVLLGVGFGMVLISFFMKSRPRGRAASGMPAEAPTEPPTPGGSAEGQTPEAPSASPG